MLEIPESLRWRALADQAFQLLGCHLMRHKLLQELYSWLILWMIAKIPVLFSPSVGVLSDSLYVSYLKKSLVLQPLYWHKQVSAWGPSCSVSRGRALYTCQVYSRRATLEFRCSLWFLPFHNWKGTCRATGARVPTSHLKQRSSVLVSTAVSKKGIYWVFMPWF